jgi:uncharacterized protein YabE (DUF348 family)
VLAVSVLTAGLVCAGFLTHPSPAYAGSGMVQQTAQIVVYLDTQGTSAQHATGAATVGDFLRERGITVGNYDFVSPASETPLSDRMSIVYRKAVPVTIVSAGDRRIVYTSADDVASMLEQQGIELSANDRVSPALSNAVHAHEVVRISHVTTWERTERRTVAAPTVARIDSSVSPGSTRIVQQGVPGTSEVTVVFTQRDGGPISAHVVHTTIVQKAKPRIIALGLDEYAAFQRLGANTAAVAAANAMHMIATAYTAGCYGCSGITATGRPAGHGIVAVDPSVIPLGAKLFIPGYGYAIAGDTGGAIRGNRIDLGFNSLRDAVLFGRREVIVYRLK